MSIKTNPGNGVLRTEIQEEARPVFDSIDRGLDQYVMDLISICEVPAPTFHEGRRAEHFSSILKDRGFFPYTDGIGNVMFSMGTGDPHVVLSAHLDTIFTFETITVTRKGNVLSAPGISDDSAGLAALLLLASAFEVNGFPRNGRITFVATVGEEGLGNLRGVRHFFEKHTGKIDSFVSLDGCNAESVVVHGIAGKRVRIFMRGPGGHSWSDAGTANPAYAAGELIVRLKRIPLSNKPKTILNIGILRGGTSINAIPTEVSLDLDLRSEEAVSLKELSEKLDYTIAEAKRNEPFVQFNSDVLGERPAGSMNPAHRLVQLTLAANALFGLNARLESGSTDSNIPLSLGIPALTLGVGGNSGKAHTPEEWYDISDTEKGLKRTALLLFELLH